MSKKLVCTQCGYVSEPQRSNKGSLAVEIVLWLCFVAPGLIYSVWRRSSKNNYCPQCKSTSLIPIDSPRAKKILEESGQNHEEYLKVDKEDKKKIETQDRNRKILWGVVASIVVITILVISN